MKCPKCGYLGFEAADRCRNCGYEFALAAQPRQQPPLSLRPEEPFGPLMEINLERGASERAPGAAESQAGVKADFDFDRIPPPPADAGSDLPLFAQNTRPARQPDAAPVIAVPPARPPLAVRRSTPTPPRVRSRAPQPDQATLDYRPEPAPVSEHTPANAPQPPSHLDATAGQRAAATAINWLLLGGLDATVLYFTLRLCHLGPWGLLRLPPVPLLVFFLVLNGGYVVAFTAVLGQTIGQMALKLKVETVEGRRVSVGRASLRTLIWILLAAPAGLGLLPVILDAARRGWHDRLTGTRVVSLREPS